jgi:N-methylhydantoinase B
MIEALYPVEVERYALVDNSGGPGRFRGAPAFVRQYRLLGEEAVLTMRSDRRRHLPYGLAGGYPGTPSWNIINPGAEQRVLPAMPMEAIRLAKGDVFCHISAGGGGHGSPLEREPEQVLEDVLEERLSTEYARRVYGVVIDPASMVVDPDATDQLRHEMSARAVTRPQPDPEYLRLFLEPLRVGPFRLSGARTLEFGPGAATR